MRITMSLMMLAIPQFFAVSLLVLLDVGAFETLVVVATVVVPASVAAVVVVAHDHGVDAHRVRLLLGDARDPRPLLRHRLLHAQVLLGLNVLRFIVEVHFVVVPVLLHHLRPFHV